MFYKRTRERRGEKKRSLSKSSSKIFPRQIQGTCGAHTTHTYSKWWYPKPSCFATDTWYCRSNRHHRRISSLVPPFCVMIDVQTHTLARKREEERMGKRLDENFWCCFGLVFWELRNKKGSKEKQRERGRRRSKILICCNISQYKTHWQPGY